MIFTGTSAELAELTRKFWGSEWWPKGLTYYPHHDGWSFEDSAFYMRPHAAASIIFAAAMVWLAEHIHAPRLGKLSGTGEYGVSLRNLSFHVGPSPLHAVLAAVEACG